MRRKQGEEGGDGGKACQNKRLEHTLLGFFKDFFQSRFLAQQFLGCSQHMDGVVDSYTQDDGGYKNRKRIQFAVEKGCKGKGRNAGVKHGTRDKNRSLDSPKEIGGKKENQHQANAKRENTVVCNFVNFLEAFVCTVYGKAGRHGVGFPVEMLK